MWNLLISINPNLIAIYNGKDETIFKLAIDKGYKVNEKDLKRNQSMRQSIEIMRKAISLNADLIKYYEKKDISKENREIIDQAIDNGYNPNMEDLIQNNNLGISYKLINKLISDNHPEAIKYIKDKVVYSFFSQGYNVSLALQKGYKPKLEDIENNPNLGTSEEIMSELLLSKENASAIKYIDCRSSDHYINIALRNGYQPTVEDLQNNGILAHNSAIMRRLIEQDSNNILLYRGRDQQVFSFAIDKGYKPEIEDLDKNHAFFASDSIMLALLKEDYNLIRKYTGNNEEVFKVAYESGFTEEKILDYIVNNSRLIENHIKESPFLIKKIIDKDINNFKYYSGINLDIIKRVLDKNYKLTDEYFNKLTTTQVMHEYEYNEMFKLIIDYDPNYIKYYRGTSIEPIIKAVEKDYKLTYEDIMQYEKKFYEYHKLIASIARIKPEYIKYYDGNDIELYINAIKMGYLPSKEVVKDNKKINTNFDIMFSVVKINPEYYEFYNGDYKEIMKFIAGRGIPSYNDVEKNYFIRRNYEIMKKLIEADYSFIRYIDYDMENALELYALAYNKGYRPTLEDAKKSPVIYGIDNMMRHLIELDKNTIENYQGTNIEIFQLAIDKGYEIPTKMPEDNDTNQIIMYMIKNKDFSILKNIEINYYTNRYTRIFKVALDLGYNITIDDINYITIDLIDTNTIKKIVNQAGKDKCIELLFKYILDDELVNYVIMTKKINLDNNYLQLLKEYYNDKMKFIENIDKYKYFLNSLGIEELQFVRYGFSISYDWLSDMIKILDDGNMQEFIAIKEWFFNNYFKNSNNSIITTKNFMSILKNYVRYPEICLDIIKNQNLSPELKENIDFLFATNNTINKDKVPKSLDQLTNIEQMFVDKYKVELNNIEKKSIDNIKDILCILLFNNSEEEIREKLHTYGNMYDLRQLLFNNRKNHDICDDILDIMIHVSMMESIVNSDDKQYLIQVANRVLDNIKLSHKCMVLFDQFDEKMKSLYEKELLANMTRLKNEHIPEQLLDKYMTQKFGIDVIDFSDKKYCLLYHKMSDLETPEELVNGLSSPEKNTICLSAGSNRNQVVYRGNSGIIFLTDTLPKGVFLRSSVSNMGSNGSVMNHSFEDLGSTSSRKQRGILETSQAEYSNSEILSFREGVKFKYIALPGGRDPTEEEIEIAKKYRLKFIKTQALNTSIKNPIDINEEYLVKNKDDEEEKQLDELKNLREKLLQMSKGPRKIAVFSDSHALFEPTLAILTDAKREGINEIYSLGDNIGTGPNPKEVLELLDEFGVVSLKGNHEIYSAEGIDKLKEHLQKTGAYNEAKENSAWTRSQLTEKQLEKIQNDPESKVIELGGKKILLSHSINDYNTGDKKEIPDDINDVFQGHIHFERKNDNITTLRGAGIGDNNDNAYYLILTERPDGGYDIEKKTVPYDKSNLYHDINESDLNDKDKIKEWVGVKR